MDKSHPKAAREMTQRSRSKHRSEFLIACETGFSGSIASSSPRSLSNTRRKSISLANILSLIWIGERACKVSDIVRKGRYVGSNAPYAPKALTAPVARFMDAEGRCLVQDIRSNSTDSSGYCRDSWETLNALENHCANNSLTAEAGRSTTSPPRSSRPCVAAVS